MTDKKYKLEGRAGNRDISFNLEDIKPVSTLCKFEHEDLLKFIMRLQAKTHFNCQFDEYEALYDIKGNDGVDFFEIDGQVVIPTETYLVPISLTKEELQASPVEMCKDKVFYSKLKGMIYIVEPVHPFEPTSKDDDIIKSGSKDYFVCQTLTPAEWKDINTKLDTY